jgi:hypothetical protein
VADNTRDGVVADGSVFISGPAAPAAASTAAPELNIACSGVEGAPVVCGGVIAKSLALAADAAIAAGSIGVARATFTRICPVLVNFMALEIRFDIT